MGAEQIRREINQLQLSEKLLLVDDIWDSIAAENSELPLAMWQKQEQDVRYKEFKDGNTELKEWQSVHEELRTKYK